MYSFNTILLYLKYYFFVLYQSYKKGDFLIL